MNEPRKGKAAKVDSLVGEGGYKITVPEDSDLREGGDREAVGGTGPSAWWRYGLGAIIVLALIVVAIQIFGGNRAATTPAPAATSSSAQ